MEEKLINIINEISTDKLKRTSHGKYVGRISQLMSEALKQDGTRLIMLIESIKSCPTACYKRDLLLDVLSDIVTSEEILTNHLLCKPFVNKANKNIPWKELANAIATIPDLIANCGAQTRYPKLNGHLFFGYILDTMYRSMDYLLKPPLVTSTAAHSNDVGIELKLIKMYHVQLLGRVALVDQNLVWSRFTSRSIEESRDHVKSYISSLFQLPINPDPSYETLETFIDRLYMPIFFNLKPSKSSGDQIYSLIGPGIINNEHLLYLICDKNIFKTNHNLDKSKQIVILFNISAYLSSLVNHGAETTLVNINIDGENDNRSLLITTLIEIARNWASSTKVLLRSYEHSRYITFALLIMFKYALKYENISLAKHASAILSIVAGAIPTYLNRTSQDHRNLAMCLGELLLPELRKLMAIGREGNEVGDQREFHVDLCVDYTDDILYIKRLFQQEVEEIFHDYSSDSDVNKSELSCGQDIALKSAQPQSATNSNCCFDGKKPNKVGTGTSDRKKIIVQCLDESYDDKSEAAAEDDDDDDDLKPYVASEDDRENSEDDDDDDYELGKNTAHVPIYLRDCVDGLVENNNHRYVRLCLEKAGELIDQLIDQDSETRDKQLAELASQRYERTSACIGVNSQTQTDCSLDRSSIKSPIVNDTIADVGVELSRALLYLENQFNIDGFNAYRLNALTSLCCASPQVVAKYLIEEFNRSNRSIQQQLDILHVLVASARRLSGNPESYPTGCKQKKSKVSSKDVTKHREQHVNNFTQFVSLYFYGIVYRLKADFADNKLLITTKPESIMSAFRELKCHSVDTEGIQQVLAKATTTSTTSAGSTTTTTTTPTTNTTAGDQRTKVVRKQSSANTLIDFTSDSDDVDKFLERNSLSDDSYLLSKILFTTALVLNCSSQQLIVGKLASDLLDILAAYRCHPDQGVQKALICCLKVIKDSTPSVYYENFIEKRLLHLFGPWLANIQ